MNSSIAIIDQNYFGNYTLKYNMIEVVTKTVNETGTYIFFIIPGITNHNFKKITKTVVAFQYMYFPDFIHLTDNSFSDVPQVPSNFKGYSYAGG